jgi:hypothetical protein
MGRGVMRVHGQAGWWAGFHGSSPLRKEMISKIQFYSFAMAQKEIYLEENS